MAQGLNLKNWDEQKSPSTDTKMRLSAILKRTRSSTGSRRIFPPQFKLQVLDSYRNDLDCRGNQRATARKYNIHRRQIQKWLQCEDNLRSSVEDRDGATKASKKFDIVKCGDGKVDATLNRSAMIYARLSDAERSRDGNAVRATPDPGTGVYETRDASKLEAWNLKRVAQKLYPSSHEDASTRWTEAEMEVGEGEREASDRFDGRDGNFNRVSPDPESSTTSIPSKECCKTDDKPIEIFTLQTGNATKSDTVSRCLNTGDTAIREMVPPPPGQKLSDENAAHKCVVQKYTDGQMFHAEKNELHCASGARAESNCLLDARSPVTVSSSSHSCDDEERKTDSKVKLLKCSDDSKSFSPKRKWMQESMQESEGKSRPRSPYSTLPIKQRVKMNLKSAAASATTSKGVSPNFTIEKLCASDIKTENTTPPSVQSPGESDYYNWRQSESCLYPGYPIVSHSTLASAALPFPPPLLFSHRVIPDLVSLHFKPESPGDGNPRSCSPESLDIPLKEEKVSDGEDNTDIDVLSTTPVEKKSFDFGSYNFGKRRSFSVQFKLTVLDAFYNDKECNKNQRATARKFNINRRQVQKWLSQESDLRNEGSLKNGKYLQRQRLGSERDVDGEETCKQCPQHCSRKKKESGEVDKTIEVNVKHCTDKECLSRDKSSPDGSSATFSEGFEFYNKGYYQSDLKSASVYENYLFPESSSMISHDSFFGWPNLNSSALPVPNFHFMASWYHNFDYCQKKSKIY